MTTATVDDLLHENALLRAQVKHWQRKVWGRSEHIPASAATNRELQLDKVLKKTRKDRDGWKKEAKVRQRLYTFQRDLLHPDLRIYTDDEIEERGGRTALLWPLKVEVSYKLKCAECGWLQPPLNGASVLDYVPTVHKGTCPWHPDSDYEE